MAHRFESNNTRGAILHNIGLSSVGLFLYGFGVYLTILADLGAAPWDVFNLGISKTFGILYGTASIAVSLTILLIDILMREPIGIAMFLDSVIVGKTVDLFQYLGWVPSPRNFPESVVMLLVGILILGYTEYLYMISALGCGPRDTLLVGVKKRVKKIPIGVISIIIQCFVTLTGYLLGGKVGIGTVICALTVGPSMQLAFFTMKRDATEVRHQSIFQSFRVLLGKASTGENGRE